MFNRKRQTSGVAVVLSQAGAVEEPLQELLDGSGFRLTIVMSNFTQLDAFVERFGTNKVVWFVTAREYEYWSQYLPLRELVLEQVI